MFAADYPFLDVVWTMLIFFAWVIWFWLLITVFSDLFRRHDISGLGKTAWIVFVIVLPYLGVFVYMIGQGKGMAERIKPGDTFVCYLTRVSRWCGLLEVIEGPFIDSKPIFVPDSDPFVVRFRVRPASSPAGSAAPASRPAW